MLAHFAWWDRWDTIFPLLPIPIRPRLALPGWCLFYELVPLNSGIFERLTFYARPGASLSLLFYYLLLFLVFPFFMFSMAHGTKSETKYPPTIDVWARVQPVFLFSSPFYFFLFSWFYDGMQGLQCPRECIYHTIIWYLTSKALHKEGHTWKA